MESRYRGSYSKFKSMIPPELVLESQISSAPHIIPRLIIPAILRSPITKSGDNLQPTTATGVNIPGYTFGAHVRICSEIPLPIASWQIHSLEESG